MVVNKTSFTKQLKYNSMKNKFLRLAGLVLLVNVFGFSAEAQNAREVSAKLNKEQRTAFQADFPVAKDLMKTTLEDRLEKAGLSKGKKYKGYIKHAAVTFSELSPNKYLEELKE